MLKIILDTNVIVSALISNTIPSLIIYELVLAKKVKSCLSNQIFEEYIQVMNRDKFTRYPDFKLRSNIVLSKLSDISEFYVPNTKIEILTDKSDNKFLELAFASRADYIITGNTLDFRITEFENTKILTPREFWDSITFQA